MSDGEYKCTAHHKIGRFDPFVPACSNFVTDDVEGSCEFCKYYESGDYKWNTTGKCQIKRVKVRGDDPSCPCYHEE